MSSDYPTFSKQQFYNYLVSLSDKYYNSQSTIPDTEFDGLVEYYENKFNESFSYLGPSGKVTLPVYLGSLDKCKDDSSLDSFFKRVLKSQSDYDCFHPDSLKNKGKVIVMEKIDGLSCLVEISGKKVRLYTRGDGYNGTNISEIKDYINLGFSFTKLKQYIKSFEDSILIRGEIVIKKDIFQKKYSSSFSNARNFVSGVINSKTKNYDMLSDLSFIAYEYINEYNYNRDLFSNKLELLSSLGFEVPKFDLEPIKTLNASLLTKMVEHFKKNAEYDIDGLVLDDVMQHERTHDNPKYSVAFKVNTEFALSTVEYVEWNISKNGIIKPRVKIEPIQLNGVTINFATGFNAKFIDDNQIGKGTIVQVTRSGDVIPFIQSVVKSTVAEMPQIDYEWNETLVDIVAVSKDTKEQWVKKMSYLFEICEVKGIREGVLTKLYDSGLNTDEKIFSIGYNSKDDGLDVINGLQSKSRQNLINAVQQLRLNMTLQKLMSGSCIFLNFGERKIIKILENIPYVKEYIEDETMQLNNSILLGELADNGFHKSGEAFMQSIEEFKNYYHKVKHFFSFDELVFDEDEEELEIEMETKASINPENIVFSGFRDKEMEKKAEKQGHTISKDITKKVTLLVVKDLESSTSKTEKAKSYGIKIVSLEQFQNML